MFNRKPAPAPVPVLETTAELIVSEAISTVEAAIEATTIEATATETVSGTVSGTDVTVTKTSKKKAAKKAKVNATATTDTTATDTTTEATLADVPNFVYRNETSTTPKAAKVPAVHTANERQERVFALLSRPDGATIKDIQGAGYLWAANAVLKMASRNGYVTSIKKVEGGTNRYIARKAG